MDRGTNARSGKGHLNGNLYRRVIRRKGALTAAPASTGSIFGAVGIGQDAAMLGEALLTLRVPDHAGQASPKVGLVVQPMNSSAIASSRTSACRRPCPGSSASAASASPHPGCRRLRRHEAENEDSGQQQASAPTLVLAAGWKKRVHRRGRLMLEGSCPGNTSATILFEQSAEPGSSAACLTASRLPAANRD
jgi:hypothetical protein